MTPLELACADVAAGEARRAQDRGELRTARAHELVELLDQLRRRNRTGVAGLVFFEFEELPETGVPEATPPTSIVRPAPVMDAVSGAQESETSGRRGTGTG